MNGPDTAALARVGVLIVNYNSGPWLARCIAQVLPEGAPEPQIIVVDNGSADASLDRLDPRVDATSALPAASTAPPRSPSVNCCCCSIPIA
jgi:GT2 family glycosyltransferase